MGLHVSTKQNVLTQYGEVLLQGGAGRSESVNLKQLNVSTSRELPRGVFQPSVGNLLNPSFSPANKP